MKLSLLSVTSFCEEKLIPEQDSLPQGEGLLLFDGEGSTTRNNLFLRNGKHKDESIQKVRENERAKPGKKGVLFFENEVRKYCRGYKRRNHCRKSTCWTFAARVRGGSHVFLVILFPQLTARSFTLNRPRREATERLARALPPLPPPPSPPQRPLPNAASATRPPERVGGGHGLLPFAATPASRSIQSSPPRAATPGALLFSFAHLLNFPPS